MRRSDLARLLTVLGQAHDLAELEPVSPVVLQQVADVLGCMFATYYELDVRTGEHSFYVRNSAQPVVFVPSRIPRADLARHLELWNRTPDGVGSWSDFYTRTARRRFEVTDEQPVFKTVDAAWMAFNGRGSRSCWLALHHGRDFTEAQRETFLRSRALVASLIRHTDMRRRLADVMAAVTAVDEERASGVLLLDSSLRVEQASPAARRIVARWFGRFGSELPPELADWLRSPFPREPRRIEREAERLVVDAPTRGVLILREERMAYASLTSREREVLSHVEDGMSTGEIAQALWVTPGTISKHLEHIYRKLGVTSRTAALAALQRTNTGGERRH